MGYTLAVSTARLRLTRPEPTEADVLASVLQYLELARRQRRVVWYARLNSGAGKLQHLDRTTGEAKISQWSRWGFKGCPDVLGQLPGGRLLVLEVKRPSGRTRPDQQAFLDLALGAGAVGGIVRSVDDVHALLD